MAFQKKINQPKPNTGAVIVQLFLQKFRISAEKKEQRNDKAQEMEEFKHMFEMSQTAKIGAAKATRKQQKP